MQKAHCHACKCANKGPEFSRQALHRNKKKTPPLELLGEKILRMQSSCRVCRNVVKEDTISSLPTVTTNEFMPPKDMQEDMASEC
jgi:hypothetical protein